MSYKQNADIIVGVVANLIINTGSDDDNDIVNDD
jgi:hypothetical protein